MWLLSYLKSASTNSVAIATKFWNGHTVKCKVLVGWISGELSIIRTWWENFSES